jgi:hypothetical protein
MELFVKTHAKNITVNLLEVNVRDCFGFHRMMLIYNYRDVKFGSQKENVTF